MISTLWWRDKPVASAENRKTIRRTRAFRRSLSHIWCITFVQRFLRDVFSSDVCVAIYTETHTHLTRPIVLSSLTKILKHRQIGHISLTEKNRTILSAVFKLLHAQEVGQDSSVGIATRYGLDGPGIDPARGMDVCVVCVVQWRQMTNCGRIKTQKQVRIKYTQRTRE
jgi:hypothetical protein